MIERLVPPGVGAAEMFGDAPSADLLPAERAAAAVVSAERLGEFCAVRACAAAAFAALGMTRPALVPGREGSITWPRGVAGALVGCAGYRAAVVARRTQVQALGLDAAPHTPLPGGMLAAVVTGAEGLHFGDLLAGDPALCWDRIFLTAKQSALTAWAPLAKERPRFGEAFLRFDGTGGFTVTPSPERARGRSALPALSGRWTVEQDLVVAVASHPA